MPLTLSVKIILKNGKLNNFNLGQFVQKQIKKAHKEMNKRNNKKVLKLNIWWLILNKAIK